MNQVFSFQPNPDPDFFIGPIPITRTVWMTWILMAALAAVALIVRRQLRRDAPSGLRTVLEGMMTYLDGQIEDIVHRPPERYFPLVATLFLFILLSNLASVVPRVVSPTADAACTGALALIVFLSVPIYGIWERGLRPYLAAYLKPVFIMLPFNVIGELSRTLALMVRLYGNVMAGAVIVGVLVVVGGVLAAPLGMLGLLTGVIQAYIFAILAMVYIGQAVRSSEKKASEKE
jgi:F-type H+-transporting ATPase subunit a